MYKYYKHRIREEEELKQILSEIKIGLMQYYGYELVKAAYYKENRLLYLDEDFAFSSYFNRV